VHQPFVHHFELTYRLAGLGMPHAEFEQCGFTASDAKVKEVFNRVREVPPRASCRSADTYQRWRT
jgi:hypothetical protein